MASMSFPTADQAIVDLLVQQRLNQDSADPFSFDLATASPHPRPQVAPIPMPQPEPVRTVSPIPEPEQEGDTAATNGDGGLPSWLRGGVLPATLAGVALGRSFSQGSIDPILGAGTGWLAGVGERQQRAAEAEKERLEREAKARQQAFENLPKASIGHEGVSVEGLRLGTAEGVGSTPDSQTIGAFVTPENLAMIEDIKRRFPAPAKRRTVQPGGTIIEEGPKGFAEIYRAPYDAGTDPTILRRIETERRLRDEQLGAYRPRPEGEGPQPTVADQRAEAAARLTQEFPHIRPRAGGYPAGVWDALRAFLNREYPRLSSAEKDNLTVEFLGPRPKEEEIEDDLDLGFEN